MSTTLSKGFKKPSAGDDSVAWMSAIEDNIELLNDHTHNGTNSELISSSNLSKESAVTVASTDVESDTNSTGWTGSKPDYILTIIAADIPSGFKVSGTSSAELCIPVIMDSDSNDERVFCSYYWTGTGSSTKFFARSNKKFNVKVLFV